MKTTIDRSLNTRSTDRRLIVEVGSYLFAAGTHLGKFYVELLTQCCRSQMGTNQWDEPFCLNCTLTVDGYAHRPVHSGFQASLQECCHSVLSYWLPQSFGALEGQIASEELSFILEDRLGKGWEESWGLTELELRLFSLAKGA